MDYAQLLITLYLIAVGCFLSKHLSKIYMWHTPAAWDDWEVETRGQVWGSLGSSMGSCLKTKAVKGGQEYNFLTEQLLTICGDLGLVLSTAFYLVMSLALNSWAISTAQPVVFKIALKLCFQIVYLFYINKSLDYNLHWEKLMTEII